MSQNQIPPLPFEIKGNAVKLPGGGEEYASPEVLLLYRISLQLDKILEQRALGFSELTEGEIQETVEKTDQSSSDRPTAEEPREQPETPPSSTKLVDLNTATKTELIALDTIGKAGANKIISQRPFTSLEDAKQKLPELKWSELEGLVSIEAVSS